MIPLTSYALRSNSKEITDRYQDRLHAHSVSIGKGQYEDDEDENEALTKQLWAF